MVAPLSSHSDFRNATRSARANTSRSTVISSRSRTLPQKKSHIQSISLRQKEQQTMQFLPPTRVRCSASLVTLPVGTLLQISGQVSSKYHHIGTENLLPLCNDTCSIMLHHFESLCSQKNYCGEWQTCTPDKDGVAPCRSVHAAAAHLRLCACAMSNQCPEPALVSNNTNTSTKEEHKKSKPGCVVKTYFTQKKQLSKLPIHHCAMASNFCL